MTISIELYVYILLALSAISLRYIIPVLIRQVRLLRAPFEEAEKYDEATRKLLVHFRHVLFALSLAIFSFGMIPITINILTLFVDTGRPATVKPISFIYTMSVHLQALMLSYLVSRLYRLASNEKEMTDFTQHHLEEELRNK